MGSSYYIKAPNANNGYVKWGEYSSENELGVRNSNDNSTTDWFLLSSWKLSSAVDSTVEESTYSLESGYEAGNFFYAIGYDGSDNDVAHVTSVR